MLLKQQSVFVLVKLLFVVLALVITLITIRMLVLNSNERNSGRFYSERPTIIKYGELMEINFNAVLNDPNEKR